MKIDRLIGILSLLLQKDMVTAPELAETFEVSRRTINRDIDALCQAGIPIQTTQGVGGGIRIMSGYSMDRTLLTSKDMQMILAGLRSLDSVSGSRYYSQLMEKIKAGSSEFISGKDSILIDLSSWYRETLEPKIATIQNCIEERHLLSFKYFAPTGESSRNIEPYYLIFRWGNWYVWGWCRKRRDFRMFKLNRMDKVMETSKPFEVREVGMPEFSNEAIFPGNIKVNTLFPYPYISSFSSLSSLSLSPFCISSVSRLSMAERMTESIRELSSEPPVVLAKTEATSFSTRFRIVLMYPGRI